MKLSRQQEISYDKVTEDIFDMSNVSIFNKEIEKEKVCEVFTLLGLRRLREKHN